MDLSSWFRETLRTGADGFLWAVEQVPRERWYATPPGGLGEWNVARHVFHMVLYERLIAVPSMRQWMGGEKPMLDDVVEAELWGEEKELEPLIEEFQALRDTQIALCDSFGEEAWSAVRDTIWTGPEPWGSITLKWVVSKTFQHTAEHTHDVMRLALFWDFRVAREQ
ncbi:MAG: hypothetical protein OJF49_004020 [Ktedonobacterales bacterium]|jgi:hypothetical protein|nr:MAG: hypothetical protein OJF49_004020 [Ktedonobacterales bacterium]